MYQDVKLSHKCHLFFCNLRHFWLWQTSCPTQNALRRRFKYLFLFWYCADLWKKVSNSISDQIPSSNQILQFNDMNPSTQKLTNNLDRAIPEISWVSIIFRTSQISNYGRGQRLKVGLLKPDAATEISCKVSSIFWTFTLKTGWIPSWH